MTTARVRNGKVRIPHQYGYRFRIVRFAVVVFCMLFLLHHFYPGFNVPVVPGISCASGVRDALPDEGVTTAGGIEGGAYATGKALRDLSEGPPNPDDVKDTLLSGAVVAGKFAGGVRAAWDGAAAPLKTPEPAPVEGSGTTDVATGGPCSPCGGVNAVPAAVGRNGIDTAARAALRAGWTAGDAVTAVAVAGPESGYRANAANASSTARGMWQTMMSYHAPKYHGASWSDPYANARVAHEIWVDAGRSWAPWVGYTSGAYRGFLARARAAISRVEGTTTTVTPAAYTVPHAAKGLQPIAVQAERYVRRAFGFRGSIGGYATSGHISNSKHYQGLAIDVMVPLGPLADRITNYFAGPGYARWHVDNVIHNHRIFNSGRGWHAYPERGNPTLNHEDHVHIDFVSGGAVSAAVAGAPATGSGDCGTGGVVGASQTSSGFTLATFNVLGASHTGVRSATRRMHHTVAALNAHRVDIVGLQEFQGTQAHQFHALTAGTYTRWGAPGDPQNSVAWRTSRFQLLGTRLVPVPYFDGHTRYMPAVHLQGAGSRLWVLNVHNPADTRRFPRQAANRARAVRAERAALAVLRQTGDPVYMTGDMNARSEFATPMRGDGMVSATGYHYRGIDWILGSPGTRFTGTRVDDSPRVDAASDHPLVMTRVPGAASAPLVTTTEGQAR